MVEARFEALGPEIRITPPGPRSRALATRLRAVECRDTTYLAEDFPIFWQRARGANVWDADDNRYVDLTAAFGVATLGHSHPAIAARLQQQSDLLVHGMGDVHPTELKVCLAEELGRIAPGDVSVALFGSSGFEAVEAALKTAMLATGRPGALAFEGGYHGLGYGALGVTWREDFRSAFQMQLQPHSTHVPYPASVGVHHASAAAAAAAARALDGVDRTLASADAIGCIVVEPIQGRGGIRIPHADFLAGLREICSRRGRLLIVDEILTGLGRTGRWFDCERSGVVPDLLCIGKSLGGGLPLSVCLGRPEVMAAWGVSAGEARHTSTFLGHPLACAAALETLAILHGENWVERVASRSGDLEASLASLGGAPGIADIRGLGLLWGIELAAEDGTPDAARTFATVKAALRRGVLVLGGGSAHNVLGMTPPFCITATQWESALEIVRQSLAETATVRA